MSFNSSWTVFFAIFFFTVILIFSNLSSTIMGTFGATESIESSSVSIVWNVESNGDVESNLPTAVSKIGAVCFYKYFSSIGSTKLTLISSSEKISNFFFVAVPFMISSP